MTKLIPLLILCSLLPIPLSPYLIGDSISLGSGYTTPLISNMPSFGGFTYVYAYMNTNYSYSINLIYQNGLPINFRATVPVCETNNVSPSLTGLYNAFLFMFSTCDDLQTNFTVNLYNLNGEVQNSFVLETSTAYVPSSYFSLLYISSTNSLVAIYPVIQSTGSILQFNICPVNASTCPVIYVINQAANFPIGLLYANNLSFLIIYSEYGTSGFWAQSFTNNGTSLFNEVELSSTGILYDAVLFSDSEVLAVVYMEGPNLTLAYYNSTLGLIGNVVIAENATNPTIEALFDEIVVVYGLEGTNDILASYYDINGNLVGYNFSISSSASGESLYSIAALSEQAGYFVAYRAGDLLIGQFISLCPQYFTWAGNCLEFSSSLSLCPNKNSGLFGPGFCCVGNTCGTCTNEICECEEGYGVNLTVNYCFQCPNYTISCLWDNNGDFIATSCTPSYSVIGSYCCPLQSTRCFINENDGTLNITGCNPGFNLIGEYCCPIGAVNCSIESNGTLVAGACLDPYVFVNNACCPPNSNECYYDSEGYAVILACDDPFVFVNGSCCPQNSTFCFESPNGTISNLTCDNNYLAYNEICCPPEALSCHLHNNVKVIVDSCNLTYINFGLYCCPPFSESCNVSPLGQIIPLNCSSGYNPIGQYCCPPESTNCSMNSTGAILATNCSGMFNVANGLCCPQYTQSCSVNLNGSIVVDSCSPGYNHINDLCCPLEGTDCTLNLDGSVTVQACSPNYHVFNNITCCPLETESCTINSTGSIVSQSCSPGYSVIEAVCCPLEAVSCYINSDGEILINNCLNQYNKLGNLCCPPFATNCTMNSQGELVVSSCGDSYTLLFGTCCPPQSASCELEPNGNINITSCNLGYEIMSDDCCPPQTLACEYSDGEIVISQCNTTYTAIEGLCCPPQAIACYLSKEGELIASKCNSTYSLYEGICCPPYAETCEIDDAGVIEIESCQNNTNFFGESCCPPETLACHLDQNTGNIVIDQCNTTYQALDGLCCPPDSIACSLNSDNTIHIILCAAGYNLLKNVCCPPEAISCYLNETGSIIATACQDNFSPIDDVCCPINTTSCQVISGEIFPLQCSPGYSIVKETCCPPQTSYCYLNESGGIIVQTCETQFLPINNFCCPPQATNCTVNASGAIQVLSCNDSYSLLDGICCPEFSAQCYLDNQGNIIVTECLESYFLNALGTCSSCQSGCETCVLMANTDNFPQCITCQDGFYMYDNTCSSICPTGTFDSLGYCCPSYCVSCNNGSSQCTQCDLGYFQFNGQCVSQCPDLYLPNQLGNCIALQAMCKLACDISFLCNIKDFNSQCSVVGPIIDIVAWLSVLVAIVKLYMLMKIQDSSILISLLRNHAYSDIMVCLIIWIVYEPSLIQGASLPAVIVFYGNLLSCVFTVEIFVYGFLKMQGSNAFENNYKTILILTYIGCMLLGVSDYFGMTALDLSPYIIIGIGGIIILLVDLFLLFQLKRLNRKIDILNLIVFPSFLAITWGLSSISFVGASLSDFYFWASFIASILNYAQPILNFLLYGKNIINTYKEEKDLNSSRSMKPRKFSYFNQISRLADSVYNDDSYELHSNNLVD